MLYATPRVKPYPNWVLLEPWIEGIRQVSRSRDQQKGGYASTKNWSEKGSTHFIGTVGEFLISIETGLPVDVRLDAQGDGGTEFVHLGKRYNVKTSTFVVSPDLKEFPTPKFRSDYYVLVAVSPQHQAATVGWATQDQVFGAELRNYRYGPMRSIPWYRMQQWGQLGMPPMLPANYDGRPRVITSTNNAPITV